MQNLSKNELNEVLIDVRKAYRLLYLYQRRVMDTVKFIGDTLSKNIQGGWALYSSPTPRNGARMNLDQWAWDWLNMYFYEFNFKDEFIISNGIEHNIKFSIAIQSDNGGYFDENDAINRTNIDTYNSVQESKTNLLFFIGKNAWKPNDNINIEKYTQYLKDGLNSVYILKESDSQIFIAKTYPLDSFINEDGIKEKLIELSVICDDNGIGKFSYSV